MGSKPVQALAGLFLVGVSLTGCRSDGGFGGSQYGNPPMIGGATYTQPNVVGSKPMSPAAAQQYTTTAAPMAQPMSMSGSINAGGMSVNGMAAPTGGTVGMNVGGSQISASMAPTSTQTYSVPGNTVASPTMTSTTTAMTPASHMQPAGVQPVVTPSYSSTPVASPTYTNTGAAPTYSNPAPASSNTVYDVPSRPQGGTYQDQ